MPVLSAELGQLFTTTALGNIPFTGGRMPSDMQSVRPLSPLMVYEPPQNKWKSLGVVSLTVQTPTSSNFTPPETQPPPPSSRWRRLYTRINRLVASSPGKSTPGDSSGPSRTPFLLVFSLVMLAGLHGTSALKIIAILAANYWIAMFKIPALTWVFNGAVLFTSNWYEGFRFGSVHGALASLAGRLLIHKTGHHKPSGTLTHKQRIAVSHPLESYSFVNFLVYALYPALYIAGPIIGFNDFMWQLRRPQWANGSDRVPFPTAYAIRFLGCLLTLEIILHMMYVVAIKDARAWHGLSPLELSMVGFWNLIVVWMKLLIPWRFFRLWALADGIDPPENMVRCMANNYSAFGFWRSWHRSYNLWFGDRSWYRHACALGGVGNILLMMGANLVGFVIGLDGMRYFISELIGSWQGQIRYQSAGYERNSCGAQGFDFFSLPARSSKGNLSTLLTSASPNTIHGALVFSPNSWTEAHNFSGKCTLLRYKEGWDMVFPVRVGGGPMVVEANGASTSRGPIARGIFPRPAALETVNLAPPDEPMNGEVSPGIACEGVLGTWRSGGSRLDPPSGGTTLIRLAWFDVCREVSE
ncbi:glycerol transporter [Rhizoctonia solani AG-1 IA]|uniref:Glycerol transporter n=1 Tax=Thanatephorus cucumeris (strain AG1-IA) TaxID=983506 RepID=L8WKR6_THACA|nr:glycerol transporter [Rhizoctonia solani AG-1 IA]